MNPFFRDDLAEAVDHSLVLSSCLQSDLKNTFNILRKDHNDDDQEEQVTLTVSNG